MIAAILALAAAQTAAPRVIAIAPARGPALLKQCSRPTPKAGSSFFAATPEQVERLERGVLKEMKLPASIRTRWRVEAVGIVRGRDHFVYGSFMPAVVPATRGVPTVVCDGGPVFFGAEMDAATGRITELATNGR